jgi:glutamate/tyrosine decarboxylase-like PLP-dependent enzyme
MRALKLWFVIREQGVARLQERLRRDLAHARWLADEVARAALEAPGSRAPADPGAAP